MNFKHITDKGYVFDRRIFWGVVILCLFLIFLVAWKQNFDFSYKFYFECKEDLCKNPFTDLKIENSFTGYDYKKSCTEEWCKTPILTRGNYGHKTPLKIKLLPYIFSCLVISGLILNHLVYNRGRRFDVKINLPDSWIKSFNKAISEAENEKNNNKGIEREGKTSLNGGNDPEKP